MKQLLCAAASLSLSYCAVSVTLAQDQAAPAPPAADEFKRPAYNANLPYNEDWSALAGRDTSQTGDFFDPIKFVPLSADGTVWASFGGQLRLRFEDFQNFNFGPTNDDDYWLLRLRFHSDLHVGPNVRIYAEGKSALMTERDLPGGQRTIDIDSIDLQNLFADVKFPLDGGNSITLRGGRQEISFGKQRLVSPLDWGNTRRTWDGVSVIAKVGDWTITPFWAQFAPVQKYHFNDPDAQTQLFGVYATGKCPITGIGLDLYFLGYDKDDTVTFNGTTGTEERYTFGGRAFGKVGDTGLDYDFEAAYQTGEVGAADVSAYMIGSQIGYKLAQFPTAPRLFVGVDVGSGDNSPGGDVETFNQLFPLGHAYLGWIDQIGRQNIIDVTPGVTLSPIEKLSVTLQGHLFWRADTSDTIYNAGGAPRPIVVATTDRYVGAEVDLLLKYQLERHTTAYFGYSHFFAGDFIETSSPAAASDVDFVYAYLEFNF